LWATLPTRSAQGIACRPAASLADAARNADIIVTTTPSTGPILQRDWLRPGTHVNAMGADTAGKQEHDVATLRDALVVDDWARRVGSANASTPPARACSATPATRIPWAR
jgi:ornithine cyclodeaminase/alanine dehydrogenase-like protein (mu-crystallin family)